MCMNIITCIGYYIPVIVCLVDTTQKICTGLNSEFWAHFWYPCTFIVTLRSYKTCQKCSEFSRGDYDSCRVSGTRQLSPLEVGEDSSKFEPKKLRKNQVHQYGQTKGCYRGF